MGKLRVWYFIVLMLLSLHSERLSGLKYADFVKVQLYSPDLKFSDILVS